MDWDSFLNQSFELVQLMVQPIVAAIWKKDILRQLHV
jgi:hypothetical protein